MSSLPDDSVTLPVVPTIETLCAQIEEIGRKANNLIDSAREERDFLRANVAEYRKWLVDRVAWLKREMDNGGNWEYLNLKREETAYCLEKLNKMVAP